MEISWYLRFHRGNSIVFLVGPAAQGQVEHALFIETGWTLDITPCEGGLRAEMHRKVPRPMQPRGETS